MNKKNQEYELFKSICQLQSIGVSQDDIFLIEELQKKGLKLTKAEQGYILDDNIQALSETTIRSGLTIEVNQLIEHLEVMFETASTNKAITSKVPDQFYTVLVTEYQSNGQGRREKKWISPLGCNIYMSIQFHLTGVRNTQFIPLITALCVCRAMSRIGVQGCRIKWPNDIYLEGKKLGGILVESRYNSQKAQLFVVGIGLNINMQTNNNIDQLWTSLRNCHNKVFDRNIILSALLAETLSNYNLLTDFDLQQFKKDWYEVDYLQGQTIQVTDEQTSYEAVARGVADDGALIIERDYHKKKFISKVYSAEVSVKSLAKMLCDTKEGLK